MELNWRETYDHAVELFGGQTPGAQLEADIVERFESHPADVVASIEKLGVRFASGRIHSPWPLVLRELDSAPDRGSITASDESDRARAIHLAERYIATAGMFLPERSRARRRAVRRSWPASALAGAQARMVAAWQARQPAAAQVEAEQRRARRVVAQGQCAYARPRHERTRTRHAPQKPSIQAKRACH